MCVGMLSNYLSIYLKTKEFGNGLLLFTKILEIICYVAPAILGIVPINKNNEAILMVITMICIFFAVTFTFAEKGNMIKSEKIKFCVWLPWSPFFTDLFNSSCFNQFNLLR